MDTKFGELQAYASMEEVYRQLRKLYGVFGLNVSTKVIDGVITHVVSIKTLVAGKVAEASADGTGNVTEVVRQAMGQLQLKAMEILNSKEVKGIPGMIKPIARKSESLDLDEPSDKVKLTFVGKEDDNYTDDESFDSDDEDFDDDCECDCDLCNADECDDEDEVTPGEEIAPGIKFMGTEEEVNNKPVLKYVGKVDDIAEGEDEEDDEDEDEEDDEFDECKSCDDTSCTLHPNHEKVALKLVSTPEGPVEPETPVVSDTQKLCCAVARKKGYKFCPDCGNKLN